MRKLNQEAIKNKRINKSDVKSFMKGTNYEIYKKLGSHPVVYNKKKGVYFAIYAPNAVMVSVVGNFNNWNYSTHKMIRIDDTDIFEIFITNIAEGELYKFCIETEDGKIIYKSDPYTNGVELRPGKASVICNISSFQWNDDEWIKNRDEERKKNGPISIYEVDLSSWTKNGERNYRDYAYSLAEYVNHMGYTHVQLINILDDTCLAYFAPTLSYGMPSEFMYLVNYLHNKGIGVILEWNPSRVIEYDELGDKTLNYIVSNALFWIEYMHLDGLSVGDMTNVIEKSKKKDVQLIKNICYTVNSTVRKRNPGVLMIITSVDKMINLTDDSKDNGLMFSLQWNNEWKTNFLDYMKSDHYGRNDDYKNIIFSPTYKHNENYILPISHKEVGNKSTSMLKKMPGDMLDKFENLRLAYGFIFGYPGKKLLFMGQDFAQIRPWSENWIIDWNLLEHPKHKKLNLYIQSLLKLYKESPALYDYNETTNSIKWIDNSERIKNIFCFIRTCNDCDNILFVFNFSHKERKNFTIGVPELCEYRVLIDSNEEKYGGRLVDKKEKIMSEDSECHGQPYSIRYDLPSNGVVIFSY